MVGLDSVNLLLAIFSLADNERHSKMRKISVKTMGQNYSALPNKRACTAIFQRAIFHPARPY